MRSQGWQVFAFAVLATACSSTKNKADVVKEEIDTTRQDKAWVKELPVEAGTTLQKTARVQRIHFTRVSEVRDAGGGYWIAGTGYAKVNDGIMNYFWDSPRPPHLEVTVEGEHLGAKASPCRPIFDEASGTKAALELLGEGDFSPEMHDGKYLGVFRLKQATSCRKLSEPAPVTAPIAMPSPIPTTGT